MKKKIKKYEKKYFLNKRKIYREENENEFIIIHLHL